MTQLYLDLPRPVPRVVPLPPLGPQWRPTGARNQRGRPIPGAPYLVAEFRDPQGGRVWEACEPRPGCEGCAALAEHWCEP